ncbi:MAG: hypothetical protein ACR2GN_07780 [Bacteroidia bacterium]
MTKAEFEGSVPHTIEHGSFGIGILQTLADRDGDKIAGYKYKGGEHSGGCNGKTWLEVYEHMQVYLKTSKERKIIV